MKKLTLVYLLAVLLPTGAKAVDPSNSNYAIRGTSLISILGGQIYDTSFSLEAWICPVKATAPIMGHYLLDDEYDWDYMEDRSTAMGFKLEMVNNQLKFTIANDENNADGSTFTESVTGSTAIPLNHWTHVAAVYDKAGQAIRVFVNGKEDGTAAALRGCNTNGRTSMYLAFINRTPGYFDGFLDEVRLWDEVKTAPDFKQSMFRPLTGSETNLDLYCAMNEGTGTTTSYLSYGVSRTANVSTSNWAASGAFSGPRNALELTIAGQGVSFSNGANTPNLSLTTAITVEAWIKPVSFGSAGVSANVILEKAGSDSYGYQLRCGGNGELDFVVGGNGWSAFTAYATNVLELNQWQHIAGTYSHATGIILLYVNGKEVARTTGVSVNLLSDANGVIGGSSQFPDRWFTGLLDEVRIWNRAQSADDIRMNMMQTVPYNTTGLVANYRMDEVEGSIVYDPVSNYNGTLLNSPTLVASTAYNTWIGSGSAVSTAYNWSNGAVADDQNVGFCGGNALNPIFGTTDKYHFNKLYNANSSDLILSSDATGTTQISVENELYNPGEMVLRKTFERNRWYFFSLPHLATFDMITLEGTSTKATSGDFFNPNYSNDHYYLLYYDGEQRNNTGNASSETGLNWKALFEDIVSAPRLENEMQTGAAEGKGEALLDASGPLKAPNGAVTIAKGKGYILIVVNEITLDFHSPGNTTDPFKGSNLSAYVRVDGSPNANPIHPHWNLVGNLYQKGFNLDALDQNTFYYIYNNATQTYDVRERGDAYLLDPNGAFFMQAGASTLNFAAIGSAFKAPGQKVTNDAVRALIQLSGNKFADLTEIRFSANASTAYVINEDAAKFLSMNPEVPQLWSVSNTVDYAVQQRPPFPGQLPLGVRIPEGTMTLSLQNAATLSETHTVLLTDHQTGTVTNLSETSYTFTGKAGTTTNRFSIQLMEGSLTQLGSLDDQLRVKLNNGVLELPDLEGQAHLNIYDLSGKKIQTATGFSALQSLTLLQKGPFVLEIRNNDTVQRVKLVNN